MNIDLIRPIDSGPLSRKEGSSQQRQPSQQDAERFRKLLSPKQDKDAQVSPNLLLLLMLPPSWFTITADQLAHQNGISRSTAVTGTGIDQTIQNFASSAFAPASTVLTKNHDTLTLRVVSPGALFGAEMLVAAMQGEQEKKKIRMTINAASDEQMEKLKKIQQNLEKNVPAGYALEIKIERPHG